MAEEKKEKKKKLGIIGEFKTFISRGNVLDMAVGLIIGSAFTAIVNSLVSDLLMPLLSMITGKVDFTEWKVILQEAALDDAGDEVAAAISINYGAFIQYIINFLLIAISVFLLVKVINVVREKAEKKKKEEEAAAAAEEPAAPDPQIVLLEEIRDLLKERK